MKNLNQIQFFDHKNITLDDIIAISEWITEENKKSPHMIQDTPQSILECVHRYGWIVAKTIEWRLAGFIKLSSLDEDMQIYEGWSLFVMPIYRGRWIGEILMKSLVEKYRHLSLLSVTNVPAVIHINSEHSEQLEIVCTDIPRRLMKIIEWPQALLSDDKVFVNHTLHARITSGQLG